MDDQGKINSPDWSLLVGGTDEASWLADRDRKLGLILALSDDVLYAAQELNQRDALFHPSKEILIDIPFAVDWYISLAGFALKTLGNIRSAPVKYGVNLKAITIRNNLTASRSVSDEEVAALAAWLTAEIESAWAPEQRSLQRALVVVSAVLGGRAIGQGQNTGGNEAVLLLKSNISLYAESSDLLLYLHEDGKWIPYEGGASAVISPSLMIGDSLMVTFPVGGNVPDVKFESLSTGQILGVGEVKGRKDLSNVWESWMPQVADHMFTWTREFPESLRLFFGTVITDEMIVGKSVRGTGRTGFRDLHVNGYLDGVFNLSYLALDNDGAWGSFNELMDYFIAHA